MKLRILLTLFIFTVCTNLTPCVAQDYRIYMTETEDDGDEDSDDRVVIDPIGPRSTVTPLICSIDTEEGVSIPGIEVPEIVSFEIRDAYGNTVAILADEASFIETLFSLSGEYRLIFRLPGRTLAGWILI